MNQSSETVQMDPEVQKLLGKLIKRGVLEFRPALTREGIHYVEIEMDLKDADSVYIEDMLQNLEKQGILEPKVVDRVLTCPDCGSPEVYSKYACPKCDSHNVEYTELVEHTKCGYIGSKDKFMKGSSLVCPGCQAKFVEELKAIAFREIGNCYQCEKCGQRFDKPEVIHFCQQCKRSFTHREAKYIKIFAYKIANETINKFSKDLPLFDSVEEILREKVFDIQFHAQLTGKSGVQHPFDIVAKRKNILLVADVSLTGDKNDAVSLLGKKMDVNPTEALLIDLSDHKELLSLGKVYGITILKGGNEKQLKRELRNFLDILDSNKNQKASSTT
jgi:hypothetical protein